MNSFIIKMWQKQAVILSLSKDQFNLPFSLVPKLYLGTRETHCLPPDFMSLMFLLSNSSP